MNNLVLEGEVHPFVIQNNFYLYSKTFNFVFEMNEKQFKYLNQPIDNFTKNEEIEKSIYKNLLKPKIKHGTKNLIINIEGNSDKVFPLLLKNILELYNSYNKIIIVIEINYQSLNLIDEIIKWTNGYERILILCRLNKEDDTIKISLNSIVKKYYKISSIKILSEYYYSIHKIVDNFSLPNQSIKIKPQLSCKTFDLNEIEKISSFLTNSKNANMFKNALKSELKIMPSEVKSISENEVISTKRDDDSICNKCWAQNICFSNNFYKMFSSHPYVCSLNKQNCLIIKSTLEKVIRKSLNDKKVEFDEKLLNKIITKGSYTLTHLNP